MLNITTSYVIPNFNLKLSWPAGHICPTYNKESFKSTGITVSHFFSTLPSTLKYLYSVQTVRMHFPAKQPCTNDSVCNDAMQHCTQYRLYMVVSQENAFWLVQWNRDISNRWQHGEKVEYCHPSGLEKTLCKWDIYVPLVTKGLN
jgi:hypothetical protein